MKQLFTEEDSARAMAARLMEIAQRDIHAAAQERVSLLAFLRGPMERHMAYEEASMFPLLVEHGLGPEVEVAIKQHAAIRKEAENLEAATTDEATARAVYLAARLMMHHTNFEGDYIYPELSRTEWHNLVKATMTTGE
ncbi:MAG: hemerythrin domain-containing protein [Deltaproteobacteria bacterium]|nr:hemerythrin domain-containing protein [Deltaproteobacteria bacterium]